MALKLGELLLQAGLITPEQLEEALKNQVIFGIRLGSSLIELGYIDENKLVDLLSKKLGVPAVHRNEMNNIPAEVIGKIQSAIAEKYRVVPFRLDGRRLAVAMSDPTDIAATDTISFATGLIVQPCIAPDLLVSYALEKYYDVKLNLRYMRVSGGLDKRHTQPAPPKSPLQPLQPVETAPAAVPTPFSEQSIAVEIERDDGELLNIEIPMEFEGFGNLPELPEEPPAGIDRYTIDKLSTDFANARSRDNVADVFIKYLGQEFSKGALFIIRGDHVVGWRAIDNGKKIKDFESFSLPLTTPSVFIPAIHEKQFFLGPMLDIAGNAQLLAALKMKPDHHVLLVPVIMQKKVVAAVLVSADLEFLGRRLQELHKLVSKASLAFEMLILKNKILMT